MCSKPHTAATRHGLANCFPRVLKRLSRKQVPSGCPTPSFPHAQTSCLSRPPLRGPAASLREEGVWALQKPSHHPCLRTQERQSSLSIFCRLFLIYVGHLQLPPVSLPQLSLHVVTRKALFRALSPTGCPPLAPRPARPPICHQDSRTRAGSRKGRHPANFPFYVRGN